MFQPATAAIARFDRPSVYYRALLHLMTVLDPIQWRRYSSRELAEEANMSVSSAERALTMLQADNVIMAKGTSSARSRRLNNQIAWASSSERHNLVDLDPEPEDARGR